MSETPELVVYETFIAGDGHPGLRTRDATIPEVVAWLREQGAIDVEDCPRCDGQGYEVVEHIRAVPEHHPSCVGGSECGSTCPVPVPYPEYEREACPACKGAGRYLVVPVDALRVEREEEQRGGMK